MARKKLKTKKVSRKIVAKKRSNKVIKLSKYTKKPEFWIGLTTVLILIFGVILVANSIKVLAFKNTTEKIISPVPSISVVPTITVEDPTPTSTSQTMNKKTEVVDNTQGNYAYVVTDGDNFYKISKKICRTGKYFRSIQAYNGFDDSMKLHKGDIITVICSL